MYFYFLPPFFLWKPYERWLAIHMPSPLSSQGSLTDKLTSVPKGKHTLICSAIQNSRILQHLQHPPSIRLFQCQRASPEVKLSFGLHFGSWILHVAVCCGDTFVNDLCIFLLFPSVQALDWGMKPFNALGKVVFSPPSVLKNKSVF